MTAAPVGTTVRRWRIALIVVGILLLGVGGLVLLDQVKPQRYLGILAWFGGALIVHDGIIAMAVFGASVLMRRSATRIPLPVIAIVQGAVVVAAIVTALVVPEILKQGIGSANASILPLNYAANLGLFYAGLAVATGIVIAIYFAFFARRQKLRPASSQD